MPLEDPNKRAEKRPAEALIECSMCHQRVPLTQSVAMSGRRLCFGCAASWYDPEEEDGDE